jgi:Ca2+/Na+ antiporter
MESIQVIQPQQPLTKVYFYKQLFMIPICVAAIFVFRIYNNQNNTISLVLMILFLVVVLIYRYNKLFSERKLTELIIDADKKMIEAKFFRFMKVQSTSTDLSLFTYDFSEESSTDSYITLRFDRFNIEVSEANSTFTFAELKKMDAILQIVYH